MRTPFGWTPISLGTFIFSGQLLLPSRFGIAAFLMAANLADNSRLKLEPEWQTLNK
jgi:hypothetical protein